MLDWERYEEEELNIIIAGTRTKANITRNIKRPIGIDKPILNFLLFILLHIIIDIYLINVSFYSLMVGNVIYLTISSITQLLDFI
ncbi:hypothetical protein ATY89_09700 [Sulfolobus acidocaldarius]|uniref:Uncharacterized protein n=3 Tax=Sulfolobus acidocaldarius TaxID=2285 RepID=M1IEB5_9CREN|nr:hypothetical protein SacN8_08175 [Sulfolobus acidocaldarius N8]AGE73868.1 hypothetical protein SacRon12I_08185 [Sulfolobus acidocaldarius Ron12/I]ALU30182.1 hypothetical protein ATY89_09700 [Sulfolobus acidocaldarius]WCM35499.1 hypothetical protein GO597_09250 [Sulfolobus acidocaldarius DSM 639]